MIVSTCNKGVDQLVNKILEHYWVEYIMKMIILYHNANKIWIDNMTVVVKLFLSQLKKIHFIFKN